jgi:hypothetical protein
MKSVLALACGLLGLSAVPFARTAAQSEPLSLASFRSVETRNGVHAILRYGTTQRVSILKGAPDQTRITIAPGDRLIIDKQCRLKCSRGYELEVEIVTPDVAHITVAHGGWLQSRGSFPRQAELDVTVDNGGTIDVRSMSVGSVTASVVSGGRILTRPLTELAARVEDGGNITYWGDARVTRSIAHGGVVTRGDPSDADRPFSELGVSMAPPPAAPVVPPSERHRHLRE